MTQTTDGAMEPKNILIFLHIPKTAGTTLRSILDREYGRKRTFLIDGDNSPKSIPEHIPVESLQKITLVSGGHLFFGIHRSIPSPSTYFTILREPVSRVVSHYYHVLGTKWHRLHELVTSRRMSLEDYVTSGISAEVDNGQTRQLTGAYDLPFGQCAESLLAQAIVNMDRHFSFVGLTESFDESVIRMRDMFGWRKRPLYVTRLRNKTRPPIAAIPDKTIAIIREQNDLDCRLYDHVKLHFQRTGSPDVIREIRKFQRVNLLYGALKKSIAFQNSIHRPIAKKLETFLKSRINGPS